MTAQTTLALWLDFIFSSSLLVLLVITFVQLWSKAYGNASGGSGLTLAQMQWYVVVAQAMTVGTPRIREYIDQEIQTGEIAYHLLRPFNYVGMQLARYMAARLLRFGLNLLVAGGLGWLLIGRPSVTPVGLVWFVAVLLGGMLLDFFAQMSIALLAFWVENTQPFQLVYERLSWLLGGLLIPVSFLPAMLRELSLYLPYRYALQGPVLVLIQFRTDLLWQTVSGQATLLAVLLILVGLLLKRGLRRVTIHGG